MKLIDICNSKTCFHVHVGGVPNWFQLRYDYLPHIAPSTGWIECVIELVYVRVGGDADVAENAGRDALRQWFPQPDRRPFVA